MTPYPSCWPGTNYGIIWQKFTPSSSGTYTISDYCYTGGNPSKTSVAVLTGTCGSLTQFACNTAGGGGCSTNPFNVTLTAGTTYYIVNTSTDKAGQIGVCIKGGTTPAVPSNDNCSGATSLTLNVPVSSSNISATPDKSLCSGSTENNVWYKFSAASTATFYFQVTRANCSRDNGFQVSVYVASMNCSSTFPGTCVTSYNNNINDDFQVSVSLTSGSTYYINVDGFAGTECNFIVEMSSVSLCAAPTISTSQTNVSCNGGTSGSATATPSGGTSPYTYAWSTTPAQNTQTATGLSAASYTVTVTGGTCSATSTITISQPAALTATISAQTNVSCNGNTSGNATAAGGGGASPFTYLWSTSPSQSTATATGLAAASYTVTVTDANGCTKTTTATITQPNVLTASISSQTNVACNGGTTGSGTVLAGGGTTGYTYNWNTSPAQTSATATGLSAATYTVTITDANSCTKTTTATITQPSVLTATISAQSNVLCNGGSTGTATVTGSGGTTGYTYNWNTSPSQTSATATGLTATSYTVTVTDANGCTKTASATIGQPSVLTAAISSQTNVACNGGTTGSATVSAGGGSTNYSYNWNTSPAQTSASATGLSASSYTVTVTDANSCTKTTSAIISQPSVITTSISGQTNVSCNGGNNGTATVTAGGGTTGYTYAWNTSPSQGSATATALSASTYIVTVTDAAGCTKTASAIITQPAILAATISSQTNVSCNGGTNGQATASGTGGTTAYSYSWNTVPAQSSQTATGLSFGSYSVTVTDAKNCTATSTVNITKASPISLSTSPVNASCGIADGSATVSISSGGTSPFSYAWNTTPAQTTATATGLSAAGYSVTVTDANICTQNATVTVSNNSAPTGSISSFTNVNCFGGNNGKASVTPSGGASPYTYLWNTIPSQTDSTATGLTAGTYNVTVSDNNSCDFVTNVVISQPTALTSSTTVTNSSCNGGSNGSITVFPSGGTSPYSYMWSAPGGQTGVTATGLSANNFTVTITDTKGCTTTSSATVSEPTNLSLSTLSASVKCNAGSNGSATVSASGATTPYSYLWDSTTGNQVTGTANGLSAAIYNVTVTDNNGCSGSVSVSVSEPAALTASASNNNISCSGGTDGSAVASGSGGTSPYIFQWDALANNQSTSTATGLGTGTYSVTVTDNNSCPATATTTISEPPVISVSTSVTNVNCNGGNDGTGLVTVSGGTSPFSYLWSNGQTSQTATGLVANNYSVTITDSKGCLSTASVSISQTTLITLSASGANSSCGLSDGMAIVNVSGGITPYSFSWNTSPAQFNDTAGNVPAGTYSVTVTDNNLCSKTTSVLISDNAGPTPTLISSGPTTFCSGDSVTLSSSVANTYLWSNGFTTQGITVSASGNYSVTVTDAGGCSGISSSVPVTVNANPTASATATDENCGQADGTTNAIGSGGLSPYSYTWSTSSGIQIGATATGLTAGSYNATVTDANNCFVLVSATVNSGSGLTATASNTNILCNGQNTSSATASPSGGSSPYTYQWSDGGFQSTKTATGLGAGTYSVTISDINQCTFITSITINEPTALSINFSTANISCFGNNDGIANAIVGGATSPYSFLWDANAGSQTTSSATGLNSGSFFLTVTDANSCTAISSATVTSPAAITFVTDSNDATCGLANGSASVNVSGGVFPYSYLWNTSPPQNGTTAINLTGGIYSVTVTDSNGCPSSANITVVDNGNPAATTTVNSNVSCNGGNNGSASVSVAGGTSPYTYQWDDPNNQTNLQATGLVSGNYNISVTDINGCNATSSAIISQPAPIIVSITSTDANCGTPDGSVSASPAGGLTPYSYLWSNGQTGSSATGLQAGNYNVTISDFNNCQKITSATVSNVGGFTATSTTSDVTCNGGSDGQATAIPAGGTSPFTFLWNSSAGNQTSPTATGLTSGTYSATVTDNAGCTFLISAFVDQPVALGGITSTTDVLCFGNSNGTATVSGAGGISPYTYLWQNGQTGKTITGLSGGFYSVTITDSNNCTSILSATVNPPFPLSAAPTVTDETCGNGNGVIAANVSGGTIPYSYLWSNGQTGAAATGLPSGLYSVTITDNNGCDTTSSATVNGIAKALVNINSENAKCFGSNNGQATANASGGQTPYLYLWSNGQTTLANTGLISGFYYVTVTDGNNCQTIDSVFISQPDTLITTISSLVNVSCNGGNNGSAGISANGGTSPYSFLWSGGQTTQLISGLAAGSYSVSLTDSFGCTATQTVIINEPSQLTLGITPNSPCGAIAGEATASVTGGTSPYNFLWSDGQTGITATALNPGTYDLTITDLNGCSANSSTTIFIAPLPVIKTTNDTTVFQESEVLVGAVASGGSTPYSYIWSTNPPETNQFFSVTPQDTTTYYVTVTNSAGCASIDSVKINVEFKFIIFLPTMFSPNADGNNDVLWVRGLGIKEISLIIYDRWGEKVFDSGLVAWGGDRTIGWDGKFKGKQMNTAVFVYMLKATMKDGKSIEKNGNITLVR